MFILIILALITIAFSAPLPHHISELKNLRFDDAFQRAKEENYFSHSEKLLARFEKSKNEAFRYHDAHKDGSEAVNKILDIPKKTRFKYLSHLLKNPTVDLSVDEGRLARTLVVDGDVKALGLLINHPKLDLSFDDNYLLKLASYYRNEEIANLLIQDSRVDNLVKASLFPNALIPLDILIGPYKDSKKSQNLDDVEKMLESVRSLVHESSTLDSDQVSLNIDSISLDDDYNSISDNEEKSFTADDGVDDFGDWIQVDRI